MPGRARLRRTRLGGLPDDRHAESWGSWPRTLRKPLDSRHTAARGSGTRCAGEGRLGTGPRTRERPWIPHDRFPRASGHFRTGRPLHDRCRRANRRFRVDCSLHQRCRGPGNGRDNVRPGSPFHDRRPMAGKWRRTTAPGIRTDSPPHHRPSRRRHLTWLIRADSPLRHRPDKRRHTMSSETTRLSRRLGKPRLVRISSSLHQRWPITCERHHSRRSPGRRQRSLARAADLVGRSLQHRRDRLAQAQPPRPDRRRRFFRHRALHSSRFPVSLQSVRRGSVHDVRPERGSRLRNTPRHHNR